ncbi:MAG: hypothetical protein NTZ24_07195 [Deltaproteobacteria bacterium]|nr:hypothetical protein [Deltaproteobacteria bacterium]
MVNLLRLIVLFALIYFLYRLFKGFFLSPEPKVGCPQGREVIGDGEDLVEDPNCHRHLPVSQAYKTFIDGQTAFFCSRKCCEQYRSESETIKKTNHQDE